MNSPTGVVLSWAVRPSFRQYVADLPDGREEWSGVTLSSGGAVEFPADPGAPIAPAAGRTSVTYAFTGAISWWGHGGALRVQVRDPHLHLVGEGRSTLSVRQAGNGADGRPVIAAFVEHHVDAGILHVPLPRLTWDGVSLFGDVYEVGAPLAPLQVALGHQEVSTCGP
ncbi:HtaA domain-containing protein [Nocardioides alkalitolerans]|uniref:HtaA domain-containing protein n=1 Tax=Nocardioides alkalitolerans TaxID=281714 RepID=UPI00048ED9E6|nr:HtaA domain-containing protein [Nocardioides alkalitolerans]